MPENPTPYPAFTKADHPDVYGRIKNLVVLMLENRSFDHVLGSLSLPTGSGPVDGLNKDLFNLDSSYTLHRVAPIAGTSRADSFDPDPPHDPESVAEQIGWPYSAIIPPKNMGGFIRAYERRYEESQGARPKNAHEVIAYQDATTMKKTYELAANFTVCDYWYAAAPTDTIPNRLYSVAGTAFGAPDTHKALKLRNDPCVFDYLDHDWVVYSGGLALAMLFNRTRSLTCDATCPARGDHFRSLDDLLEDAHAGELRRVSWVEPIYTWEKWFPSNWFKGPNDDHPPSKVQKGQRLLASIYAALATGKSWDSSAFVFTYDEHGGFYDHVLPPRLPMGAGDDGHKTYGLRVPTLVVSPFAKAETSHDRFDHCSVLKFIAEWVGTPEIKAWAASVPRIASDHIQNIATLLTGSPRAPIFPSEESVELLASPSEIVDREATETHSGVGNVMAVLEYQLSEAQPDFAPLQKLAVGGVDRTKTANESVVGSGAYIPPWER